VDVDVDVVVVVFTLVEEDKFGDEQDTTMGETSDERGKLLFNVLDGIVDGVRI
jgi:hypothetical protein